MDTAFSEQTTILYKCNNTTLEQLTPKSYYTAVNTKLIDFCFEYLLQLDVNLLKADAQTRLNTPPPSHRITSIICQSKHCTLHSNRVNKKVYCMHVFVTYQTSYFVPGSVWVLLDVWITHFWIIETVLKSYKLLGMNFKCPKDFFYSTIKSVTFYMLYSVYEKATQPH